MNNIDRAVELAVIAARLAELLTAEESDTYNIPIANLHNVIEDLELARCHPASHPWSSAKTAAYPQVWEELEIGSEADFPLAA